MTDIQYRNLFIDGNKRTSGNAPSNFTCLINNNDGFFNLEKTDKYYEKIYLVPQQFKILNDFYNISSSGNTINNQFGFSVNTILSPTTNDIQGAKVSIPTGYYTAYSLLDWLNENVSTELNDSLGDIAGDGTHYTFTFYADYDADTNKYSFRVDADNNFFNTYNLRMRFQDTILDYGGDLEFTGVATQFLGTLPTTILPITNTYQETPYTLDFILHTEIYVYCNIVYNNRQNTTDGVISSDLMLTIDNDQPKLSYFNFFNDNDIYITETIENIQEFNFRITDKNGTPIDFLTYPLISLTFRKHKIYRENKIEEILDNILKLQELNTLYERFKNN